MDPLRQQFLDLSDKFFTRFTARLEGLTDEEYLWEPAPDCWSLRRGADGRLEMHWGLVFDEPHPVTTIAWRYTHVIDLLSEERCATWVGLDPEPEDLFADGAPPDAKTAREMLERAFARWKRYVGAVDDYWVKLGPLARDWSERPRATFVLHILDEVIHHGAEIGVLRDLYRARAQHDPEVSALLYGEELPAEAIERVRARRPDLVLVAAELAYWEAIPRLLELGFGVEGRGGRTPLHHAAAEGRVDMVKLLIDAGADVDVRDPVYEVPPVEWAKFFRRREAVELLERSKV